MSLQLEGAGFSDAQHIEYEEQQGNVFLYAGVALAIFVSMIVYLTLSVFTRRSAA